MAARLTDRQKKKIVADFAMLRNYSAVARMNGVSDKTVKSYVEQDPEFLGISEQKNKESAEDVLAYMDRQRDAVCEIIGVGLEVLPEKIRGAKTASEITTALGTLIDKWAPKGQPISGKDQVEDDPITKSLKEEAQNGL